VIERIIDGLCQLRLGEQLANHRGQPRLERFHQRCGPGAAGGKPLLGAQATDLRLDGIDCLQPLDHLAGERRLRRLVHLDELAPRVRETESEPDRAVAAAGKRLVGGIAVHLQNAGEARQLPGDLVGAAAVGEHIGHRRR
jgi:hypothetical protein